MRADEAGDKAEVPVAAPAPVGTVRPAAAELARAPHPSAAERVAVTAAYASGESVDAILAPRPRPMSRRERKANAWQGRHCENCQIALQGPFCHGCGQPERTPVRALFALAGDAVDYLFDLDSRLLNTLKNLFFRPGRLTEAYLRGQRMSFVRPLRIYIVVSALLFVVISATTNDLNVVTDEEGNTAQANAQVTNVPGVGETGADTVAAPGSDLEAAAVDEMPPPPILLPVRGEPETAVAGKRKPISLTLFGSKPWHATDNPLEFAVFPDAVNRRINIFIGTVIEKSELARENPKRLGHEFLRVLPQSMFVLLPIFALLLKVVMVFKRRLYMEHLMVAVHSHTFIFMGILVAVVLGSIEEWWPTTWLNPWGLLTGLTVAWIPINLFLTQKRVYRQSFLGAAFGSLIISTLYLFLVSFTALGALVLSLVNL